ncbi:MAG: methyltransferase domain-containing protein [Holosporaceae bacterium]|jgi:ubiquinone/menaquinone biosynthesis C-methylase UbiE|nr:methyltransferase domain-containing protein [Holosporaceae bacterium]
MKRGKSMILYNKIGDGYDNTRKADQYIVSRLISHLNLSEGEKCLDIACGSGNYAIALAKRGLDMYGIDESVAMIKKARKKNSKISWAITNAESLPFESCFFDGIICTLAIHHFSSMASAFNEAYRTLKSGRFVIFTSTKEQMEYYWLNEYFPKTLSESSKQMPKFNDIINELYNAGFYSTIHEKYDVRDDLNDLFLYSGKNRPELYLDPVIRAGISSFANSVNKNEINEGVNKLANDIKTGKINKIKQLYENSHGEYLFIVAHKA